MDVPPVQVPRWPQIVPSAGTCVLLRHTSPNLICVFAPQDVWGDQLYEQAERVRACLEPWHSLDDLGEDAGVLDRDREQVIERIVVEVHL
jgi:hypothetical protein